MIVASLPNGAAVSLSGVIVGIGIPTIVVLLMLTIGAMRASSNVRALVCQLTETLTRLTEGEIDGPLPDCRVYGAFPGLNEAMAGLQSALISRRHLFEKLRESEERFRVFQEMSPDGFVIFGAERGRDGRISGFRSVYANDAAGHLPLMVGSAAEPSPGWDLFQRLKRVAETGASETFERYEHRSDRPGWVRHLLVKLNDGVAMVEADVTEIKRAQLTKSSFLAAASHDLRQPFQALRLFLAVLDQKLTEPAQRKAVEHACLALGAGEDLLNSLMDLSAIEAGVVGFAPRVMAANQILDWCREHYAPAASLKGLEFRVMPSRAVILTDQSALRRILGCLIDNALRFASPGKVLVGCRQRGSRLYFEVWDNGPGIPADKLPLVFEEFYQLGNPERDRRKGLGLGLAVARRTAEALGHELSVRSEVGRGTVFSLKLAIGRSAATPKRLLTPIRAHG